MKWSSSGSTSGSLGCPIESLRRAFYWTICFLRTGGLTKSFPPSLLSLWTTPYVPEWRVCCWLLVRPRIPVPNQDRTVPDRSAPSVSGSNQCRPLPPPPWGGEKHNNPGSNSASQEEEGRTWASSLEPSRSRSCATLLLRWRH